MSFVSGTIRKCGNQTFKNRKWCKLGNAGGVILKVSKLLKYYHVFTNLFN